MVSEAELAFECVEDGLHPLTGPAESAKAGFFVFAVRTDQRGTEVFGDEPFEIAAGKAFVAEDDLPGVDQPVLPFEQRMGDFTFPELGVRQSPGHAIPSVVLIRVSEHEPCSRCWATTRHGSSASSSWSGGY